MISSSNPLPASSMYDLHGIIMGGKKFAKRSGPDLPTGDHPWLPGARSAPLRVVGPTGGHPEDQRKSSPRRDNVPSTMLTFNPLEDFVLVDICASQDL